MNATLFSISSIILSSTSIILLVIILIYGKLKCHRVWALFNFSLVWWGVGAFLIGRAVNEAQALALWKITSIGIIFIAVFFYHFFCVFLEINRKPLIILAYIQAFFFSLLCLLPDSSLFINSVEKIRDSSLIYLRSSGLLYDFSFLIWILLVSLGFIETFFKYIHEPPGVKKNQFSYLLLGFFLGFSGGLTNFLPVYGIHCVPVGNFTISFYCVISTYAILRYKLLDMTIAVTRAGVFFIVYTFILGGPLWLGWQMFGFGSWLLPVAFMGVLATIGPYIYLFMQRKAEDSLLKEQRRYQATLIQASSGMGRIKELRKLLKMIVRIVTRVVRVEHSAIYILDKNRQVYCLGGALFNRTKIVLPDVLPADSAIIQRLTRDKRIIISDDEHGLEEKARSTALCMDLSALMSVLVIPSMLDDRLVGFVCLGSKLSGKPFSPDDLSVFMILANHSALAIENAQFYEDVKRTQEQLFKAEKMATIGTMADGLSHQINNRLHAMGFIAGDMQDTLDSKKELFSSSPGLREMEKEFSYALSRLQENVTRGGEIVQGLMKYTRKGDEGQSACDINAIFDSAYEMVQFKVKTGQMEIIKDYHAANLPVIRGNFTQLQEVFFNLIDNAYDAMIQRKSEQEDPAYKLKLTVSVSAESNKVRITFADTGIGVKEEDKHKLFTPFFTTKISTKKGTGLGLYVIRKIVEDNHGGHVDVASQYLVGTTITVTLFIM